MVKVGARSAQLSAKSAATTRSNMDRIQIYTIPNCIWCDKAKALLTELNIPFEAIMLETPEQREKLKLQSGQKTAPVVYINGKLVGGFSDLELFMETFNGSK